MSDRWTDSLSDFLDGHLPEREREQLEAHLLTCGECARDLAALREVAARARSLEAIAPPSDLWPAIRERIAPAGALARRRVPLIFPHPLTLTLPQALAAGITLVLLSGGTVWWLLGAPGLAPRVVPAGVNRSAGPSIVAGPTLPSIGPENAASTNGSDRETANSSSATGAAAGEGSAAQFAAYEAHYDQAIAELERTLADNRTVLDTSTVRVVEQNLVVINRAIRQAHLALEADPASPYLHQHLALQMKLKLDLLRRAAAYTVGQG